MPEQLHRFRLRGNADGSRFERFVTAESSTDALLTFSNEVGLLDSVTVMRVSKTDYEELLAQQAHAVRARAASSGEAG